jgi:Protein of unknown function (DUF4238)
LVGAAAHHFLPQFYLKGFTDPDPPRGHTPFLWIYKFEERRWRKRSPANAAKRAGFYLSTTEWGETHDLLEQSLSLLESVTAPIVREKIPRCSAFTAEERMTFAAFVGQMAARTPAGLELVAEAYKAGVVSRMKHRVERWKKNPDEWEKFTREFNEVHPEKALPNGLRPEDIDPVKFRVEVEAQQLAAISLASAWRTLPLILDMGWIFLRSEAPLYFVTSDNPCARIDPDRPSPFPRGMAVEGVEISLPLSRTHCFVGSSKWKGVTWRLATRDLVADLNKRSDYFATMFIAGPKPGFPGVGEILARRETGKEVRA